MKEQMQQVWFRSPKDLVEWLEQRAAELTVSDSDFIRMKLLEAKNEGR
jgi:hypothetical protein